MVDAEQSFIERMNTTKFLLWWNRGMVEGSNILGAFNNYMRFKVTTKYADLIKDKSIHESRQAINDILMAGTCVNVEDFYKLCKKLWNIMRIVLYMARKSKLMLDLQIALEMMLKRGNKLARKAIIAARLSCRSNDAAAVLFVGPHEYEFSCSNSPAASLFPSSSHYAGSCKRRKRNRHKNRRRDDDIVSFQKVLGKEIMAAASPLPVRQFPLKDSSEGGSEIDKDAEEFINKFYTDLKKQRRIAALEPPSPFHIWAH
nr:Transcription factor like [Ipomoea batatas]